MVALSLGGPPERAFHTAMDLVLVTLSYVDYWLRSNEDHPTPFRDMAIRAAQTVVRGSELD